LIEKNGAGVPVSGLPSFGSGAIFEPKDPRMIWIFSYAIVMVMDPVSGAATHFS